MALFLAISALPISASAGLMSAISDMFSRDDEYLSFQKNVQHIALLASSSNPSNDDEVSGLVVDESALEVESSPSTTSGEIHRPTSDQISVYVVREGDTLSQIAEMFNVTVNTIRWNNDLKNSVVQPGQTLVILPISGIRHTVAKGDTLASISKKYKGDVDEIAGYNGVAKDSKLVVGTVVIIPDGEISTSVASSGSSVGSGLASYSGYYMRPVAGGKRTQGIHGHNGIDIGAPAGTAIMAAAPGEVIIARSSGWNGGYGSYVVIRHGNGTQTLYAHLSSVKVSIGQSVEQGEVIGGMGSSGKSTGIHLHFEIRGAKNPF